MLYINQRDYPNMPYPNNVAGACRPESQNIARAGCGICTACMLVDHLTTQSLSMEECIQLSIDSKSNLEPGTDLEILGAVLAEKFDLKFSYSADKEAMLACLRRGGRVIINVANRPDGTDGLFTHCGHYMLLVSVDGERVCFLDPYYHDSYDKGDLKEKVDSTRAPLLYCDAELLHKEAENRRIRYYLFERK